MQFKKDLQDLKQQKENDGEITLERIKNIFLHPIKAKKEFETRKKQQTRDNHKNFTLERSI